VHSTLTNYGGSSKQPMNLDMARAEALALADVADNEGKGGD